MEAIKELSKELSVWMEEAKKAGFTGVCALDCATLRFLPEIREMCRADRCQKYGRCWTCPPGCGTVEECDARAASFHRGIIVQTTAQLEDSFDIEGMDALSERHMAQFAAFRHALRKDFPGLLALGSGGCTICEACTYPDGPCRFPDKSISSMEAYGLFVSEVCEKNGIPYYYGPNTMTYVGCYLLE